MSENELPEPPDQSQDTNGIGTGTEKHKNRENNSERSVDPTAQLQSSLEISSGGDDMVVADRDDSMPVEASTIAPDTLVENAHIELIEHNELGLDFWNKVKGRHIDLVSIWEMREDVKKTLNDFEELIDKGEPRLLFDDFRLDTSGQLDVKQKAFKVDAITEEREIWFLGDIHSDLLALESVIVFLEERSVATKIPVCYVFLGDLFDDGDHGAETILRVLRLILDHPRSVTVIAGNHDEALYFEDGKFHSSVSPCEFNAWLNEPTQRDDDLARKLGDLTIKFFERAPRALFFSDGLLVAHGGVPLSDRWEKTDTSIDLNDSLCLQDFVWTRPHHRRKRTIPNRTKKGAGLGYEDFSAFCDHVERLWKIPVRRMIRGHDHVDKKERFESFEAYRRHPLLTINTLCRRLERESFGEYVRAPCIAKHVPGKLPEIHCLRIPDGLVRSVYPEQTSDA